MSGPINRVIAGTGAAAAGLTAGLQLVLLALGGSWAGGIGAAVVLVGAGVVVLAVLRAHFTAEPDPATAPWPRRPADPPAPWAEPWPEPRPWSEPRPMPPSFYERDQDL